MAPPVKKRSRWRKGAAPEAAAPVAPIAGSPGSCRLRAADRAGPPGPDHTAAAPAGLGRHSDVRRAGRLEATRRSGHRGGVWDGQPGAAGSEPAPDLGPPGPGAGQARAEKAAKAAAVGTAAGAAAFAAPPAPGWGTAAPGVPAPSTAPFETAPGPPPPPEPGAAVGTAAPKEAPRGRNNRLLVLLPVALVVVVGGIALLPRQEEQQLEHDGHTVLGLSATAADTALAASINLHQTDLPVGWSPTTAAANRPDRRWPRRRPRVRPAGRWPSASGSR